MARSARRSGNLPADATSFIGRCRELAEVRKRLTAVRLVSLVGPGGVGKTRLAIRIAADLARGFPDGAWLVELADVRDSELIDSAVMTALDLRDQAGSRPLPLLLSYLRDKQLLLVLDNCEHLLGAAAQLVTRLIGSAPGLRVIVTSRQPLSVPAEHVIPLPPLELPPADSAESLERVRQNEAVMLFTERAAAASGAFELTPSNQVAVMRLCRRLDGLPLAIELAAVRTRVLTAQQILDRLSDRFGLLTGGSRAALPRQQTLRTTMDWSHDLLETGERALLRRLSVFAGRFRLEDVEAVCSSDDLPAPDVLELVSSLVDKSLVIKEDANSVAGYRLHETMREYAGLKSREAGEDGAVERRCAEYYGSRCRRSASEARYRLVEWLDWMDLEIDNVRSVLRRCLVQEDYQRGLEVAVSIGWYWFTRATAEGLYWLDSLLASGSGRPGSRAWAYYLRGFISVVQADPVAARPALERAIAAARETGQLPLLSCSLSTASMAENMAGERASAMRLLEESRAIADAIDAFPAAIALHNARAMDGFFRRDLDAVRSASTEGARISREAGDLYSLGHMLENLGFAALLSDDLAGAGPLLADALRIARRVDDRVLQSHLVRGLGCCAAASGAPLRGARLLGAADTIRAGVGAGTLEFLASVVAQVQESAIAALGRAKFDAEFTNGQRLSRDVAIGLALGESGEVAAASGEAAAGLLAKREAEVARLIADGLTNKQIGARLFISERTVEGHVRNVLNKLGFSSRAQIAGWIASPDH